MTPQLSGLLSHHAVSRAVRPERTRIRAAKVLKASLPPKKMGTSKVTLLTVQLASAVSKASPSVVSLSSARLMVVKKSCLRFDPSVPPQLPRHSSSAFLHLPNELAARIQVLDSFFECSILVAYSTWLRVQARTSYVRS